MKKKLFILMCILILSISASFARPITITTSCGKTIIVESGDFQDIGDLMDKVEKLDSAMCD